VSLNKQRMLLCSRELFSRAIAVTAGIYRLVQWRMMCVLLACHVTCITTFQDGCCSSMISATTSLADCCLFLKLFIYFCAK
jgi:hypothetical protein